MPVRIGTHTCLTLAEVAKRLGRSTKHVERMIGKGMIAHVEEKPPLIRETALWAFLIKDRDIRPRAFGPQPLSPEAEAALREAEQGLLADRLAEQLYDEWRRSMTPFRRASAPPSQKSPNRQ